MHLVWNRRTFLKFILPIAIAYTICTFVPIAISMYYSTTNFTGFGSYDFVGLKNFEAAFQDKFLWISFRNTLVIVLVTMALLVPLSFLMALAIQKKSLKTGIYKTIYFLPYTLSGTVVALIWKFILDPNIGWINTTLASMGADTSALEWIGGKYLSPISFSIIIVWALCGFCMLLWLNGLKQLPGDMLEASVIDGVTKRQQVTKIILPNLRSTAQTVLIFVYTAAIKLFEYVYVLTSGGPNHASDTIVSYMYNITFKSRLYGYGAAIAVIELAVAVAGSLVIIWLINRKEDK